MTYPKHLLNDEDYNIDELRFSASRSQPPLLASQSTANEDAAPSLLIGNWDEVLADLHGVAVRDDDPFDFFSGEPDLSFAPFGVEDVRFDFEQWGYDAFVEPSSAGDEYANQKNTERPYQTSVVATPGTHSSSLTICYGMVYRSAAKLTGNMPNLRFRFKAEAPRISGHGVLRVGPAKEGLWLLFPDGSEFAQLNAHHTMVLKPIVDIQNMELEALVDPISLQEILERATKSAEATLRVNINLYGPRDLKDSVGQELSRGKVYLQQPDHTREGTAYENPHFLYLSDLPMEAEQETVEDATVIDSQEEPEQKETLRETVCNIYKSLRRGANLKKLEADASLQTSLLPHQQEALDFMTQREVGPIAEEFCLWKREDQEGESCYRHVITNHLSQEQPSETGGGVLADAMGLGKTLSVLSLIAKTRELAQAWMYNDCDRDIFDADMAKTKSRATLVLVSSYLLLNHWLAEVDRHLDGTFAIIKHHGQRRERISLKIAESDVVVTTYHTLAAEMADRKSPLHEIAWYRVVLDEAHIIRHRQTTFYRTVSQLNALNRWCLTGTPIQNTLDDIGTLFSFIRVRPFDSIGIFRSFVTAPFDEGPERQRVASKRLAAILDSLCLRRTRDVVALPEQHEVIRYLAMSASEREQYDRTKNTMNRAIRQRFGDTERKNIFGLFQAQLQLRLFCNHGTFQNPFSWTNHRNMVTERESFLEFLGQGSEINCACCQQPLSITSTNSTYNQYVDCRHICCWECLDQSAGGEDLDEESRASKCPVCESSNMTSRIRKQQRSHNFSGSPSEYFRANGFSTKMSALVTDVQRDLWSSKSVIFSCWTRTLDLVEKHFTAYAIPFARIDGSSPLHARQRILDNFSQNRDSPILLMTTGTGAFGLNIPVANRIFIIESQWNPHTERQAIARAMRLGQQHSIVVYRYVIKQSVEQEMRSQQHRKLQIAEVGWDSQ